MMETDVDKILHFKLLVDTGQSMRKKCVTRDWCNEKNVRMWLQVVRITLREVLSDGSDDNTIVKIPMEQVTPEIVERVRSDRGQSLQVITMHIELMETDPQITITRIGDFLRSVTSVDACGNKRKPISADWLHRTKHALQTWLADDGFPICPDHVSPWCLHKKCRPEFQWWML